MKGLLMPVYNEARFTVSGLDLNPPVTIRTELIP